jgi:hypothetical protein
LLIPPGPDLQDHGVVPGRDRPAGPRPQCRDRDRRRVVRVALARAARLEQPHPGGELGLHVEHQFPGGEELLGQQSARPAGSLDGPGPVRPLRRPPDKVPGLPWRGFYPDFPQLLLGCGYRYRRVRAFMRIHSDHRSLPAPLREISQAVAGRQAVREPAHRTPERYGTPATPASSVQSGGYLSRLYVWHLVTAGHHDLA